METLADHGSWTLGVIETASFAYLVAFAAALAGTAVGGFISWVLHRSSARRDINLHIIEAAYVFHDDVGKFAQGRDNPETGEIVTAAPQTYHAKRSAFRLKLLLVQRHRVRSVVERISWRKAESQRKRSVHFGEIDEAVEAAFQKVWGALKWALTSFTVSMDHRMTLGNRILKHLNQFQGSIRAALEHLPAGGIDQFLVDITDAAVAFEQQVATDSARS